MEVSTRACGRGSTLWAANAASVGSASRTDSVRIGGSPPVAVADRHEEQVDRVLDDDEAQDLLDHVALGEDAVEADRQQHGDEDVHHRPDPPSRSRRPRPRPPRPLRPGERHDGREPGEEAGADLEQHGDVQEHDERRAPEGEVLAQRRSSAARKWPAVKPRTPMARKARAPTASREDAARRTRATGPVRDPNASVASTTAAREDDAAREPAARRQVAEEAPRPGRRRGSAARIQRVTTCTIVDMPPCGSAMGHLHALWGRSRGPRGRGRPVAAAWRRWRRSFAARGAAAPPGRRRRGQDHRGLAERVVGAEVEEDGGDHVRGAGQLRSVPQVERGAPRCARIRRPGARRRPGS